MANILLKYWYGLYTKIPPCQILMEKEICKLGVRYRVEHPFIGQKAFADFYFPDHRLCLEIDDPSHEKLERKQKDRKKQLALSGLGIQTLRCTNSEVLSPTSRAQVLANLQNQLKSSSVF